MILPILGRLVATFYAVAPFAAFAMIFFNSSLALTLFMVWIISAGTVVAVTLLCIALAHIWGNRD